MPTPLPFSRALAASALALSTIVPVRATAWYVYHEATSTAIGCGGAYVSPARPLGGQAVTVRFKVERQFYTNRLAVYYTTDGSAPSGAFGVGTGSTQALTNTGAKPVDYECTFGDPAADVARAVIPGQPAGTMVKYIVSAWHDGGGPEIFASGPGPDCNCGPPTDSAAKATVFSYGVPRVVISQVYGGGGAGGALFRNDFVELYNAGPFSVDLSGWTVQYTSSTGTSWGSQKTNLACTVPPGGYLLVQGGSDGTTAPTLPAPDVTGTTNLSGSAGKVALVNSTTGLPAVANPASDPSVADLLGYGSVNGYEGTAAAGLSSATASHRKFGGLQDTNSNGSDFRAVAPRPRNSAGGAMRGVSLGAATKSSPVAFQGKAWLGADDGLLRGYDLSSMAMLPGFPFDARAFDGSTTRRLLGRPALRLEGGSPYLYAVSDDARVFKLDAGSGVEVWRSGPLAPGATGVATAPAVAFADDVAHGAREYVYVAASGAGEARVYKLIAAGAGAGTVVRASPVLGQGAESSPAAYAMGIYVGVAWGAQNGVLRLSPMDLTPSVRFGESSSVQSSPFVYGPGGTSFTYPVMYAGTIAGEVLALNAANGNPVPEFGAGGVAALTTGEGLTDVFVYGNRVYAGTKANAVLSVSADTGGGKSTAFAGVNTQAVLGVAVDPGGNGGAGALCFGSTDGALYQTSLSGQELNTVYGTQISGTNPSVTPWVATPSIDTVGGWVVAVNANGTLLRLPRR